MLDQIDRQLYRYRRDGSGSVDASRVMTEIDGGSTRAPYGVVRSNGSVLVVDASRDKIYAYNVTGLFTGTGPINATSEMPLDPLDGSARDVAILQEPGGTTTTTVSPLSTSTSVTTTTSTTQTTLPPLAATFFTVDAQDKRVYRYDGGSLAGSFPLAPGNDHGNGVAVHSGTVRVLDSTDRRIYEYDQSGTLLAVSRELRQGAGAALSTTAGAIALAADDVWLVDRGEAKLLRYSLAAAFTGDTALNAAQEIALNPSNARAEGLTIDATYLYVLDQIDRQLYRYPRDGVGAAVTSGIVAQVDGSSTGAPYGVSRAEETVLVVDGSRDKVYSYDLAALFQSAGVVAATAEVALDAANDDARDVASGG